MAVYILAWYPASFTATPANGPKLLFIFAYCVVQSNYWRGQSFPPIDVQ